MLNGILKLVTVENQVLIKTFEHSGDILKYYLNHLIFVFLKTNGYSRENLSSPGVTILMEQLKKTENT